MEKIEIQLQIQLQIQRWLSRKTTSESVRQVAGLPIALSSDTGLIRSENQDRLVLLRAQVTNDKSFVVGVLCDGMGGMVDGEVCAELAVSFFIASCIINRQMALKERLLNATNSANDAIYEKYHGDGGATLSAFIMDNDRQIEVVNVGDSRIYLETDRGFEQITTDDTIAGQLKNNSYISEVSGLLQYIGIGPSLEPHFIELPPIDSISKLLMTSDGVHYIAHETLKRLVQPSLPASEIIKRLTNVAKWCGGHDNASALLITDLHSLFSKYEEVHTGTVEIWDPFGDVQFVGIEKSLPKKPTIISNASVGDASGMGLPAISPAKPLSDNKNNSKNDNSSTVEVKKKRRSNKNEITSEKLNLRIDFDE